MAQKKLWAAAYACVMVLTITTGTAVSAEEPGVSPEQLRQLQQQNQALQEQLRLQQGLIESLNRKVNEIQQASAQRGREVQDLQTQFQEASQLPKSEPVFSPGKVSITAEGGIGFFKSGSEGRYPKGDFRVDEAKLFIESPILDSVYFFSEINLATPESYDPSLHLGEAYIDFENVSRFWHWDRMLSVRLGRIDIPFGEEYIYRDAIDNPLISHSLTDFWGVD